MKRSNFQVMKRLLAMMTPMMGTVVLAVILGVLGNLCAIFIPVLGAYALTGSNLKIICTALPILAVARGILHYAEQNRNHYLAFKILALIQSGKAVLYNGYIIHFLTSQNYTLNIFRC